jgi:transmembrane sensor
MDTIGGPFGGGGRLSAEDIRRIEQHLAGSLPAPEAEAFAQWVAADPARGRLVAAFAELWRGDGPDAPSFDIHGMWARMVPRIRERRRVLSLIRRDDRQLRTRGPWSRVPAAAAAAVLIAVLSVAGWLAVRAGPSRERTTSVAMREFSTRRGQRADLRLDDGTQVVLGAATIVHIPDDYGDRTRDVYLNGEAYFVVRHDAAHPFAVHTGHATIRDIGTQFAVTAYDDATHTEVVVVDGEVSVAHIALRRNDLAIVDSAGQPAVVRHGVDAAAATGWTEGRLVLEATPFQEVVAELSRWYDLDIQLADPSLGRQQLTVTFGSESTRQVLDALAMLTHTHYEQHGRTVTFSAIPGT